MLCITQILDLYQRCDQKYPHAGSVVGGLTVIDDVPNTASIGASFENYRILRGYREIELTGFVDPKSFFYAANDFRRARQLAEEIQTTRQIKPLIIAVDENDEWILEGVHRILALHYLNIPAFPALIVIDED